MNVLSKTTKILTRSHTEGDDEYARQWFTQVDPDDGHIKSEVYLSRSDFMDMGEPETITITIEPRDRLN